MMTANSNSVRFDDKLAVVTGGASGIGSAVARRFAGRGACVRVLDIDESAAAAVAKEIETDGGNKAYCCSRYGISNPGGGWLCVPTEVSGNVDYRRSRFSNPHGLYLGSKQYSLRLSRQASALALSDLGALHYRSRVSVRKQVPYLPMIFGACPSRTSYSYS